MRQTITFAVPGPPATKGSSRHVGGGRLINDNRRTKGWSIIAKREARSRWKGGPRDGAAIVLLSFFLKRPKSHYGSSKGQPYLRDDAPRRPLKVPDVDKVARACLDALTKVAYADDSQVVRLVVEKFWAEHGDEPRTTISVSVEE